MLFYETNHRKERNDGKDTTDTDFPCLLPLRKKQKIFCYYIGMRLDHNRYSETRSDTMLANPLFYADWPLL